MLCSHVDFTVLASDIKTRKLTLLAETFWLSVPLARYCSFTIGHAIPEAPFEAVSAAVSAVKAVLLLVLDI